MNTFDLSEMLQKAVLFFIPFLFALCFHEFAHAWMAKRRGDRTAEMLGRLSLNPTVHADPIGTVALPLLALFTHLPLFGWAKPVPVNTRNLARPREDMFWIALAGPASNLLLAVLSTIAIFVFVRLKPDAAYSNGTASVVLLMLKSFLFVNVLLAVFNMIPLHPLDGGKVLARFLPERINRVLEDAQVYSGWALMAFFVLGGFAVLAVPIRFLQNFLLGLATAVG